MEGLRWGLAELEASRCNQCMIWDELREQHAPKPAFLDKTWILQNIEKAK